MAVDRGLMFGWPKYDAASLLHYSLLTINFSLSILHYQLSIKTNPAAHCYPVRMQSVTIIFPHQLFKQHPALAPNRVVYLVEEGLFFTQYRFHQQKLILHRASMKAYQAYLLGLGHTVHYIEAMTPEADCRLLLQQLATAGVQTIHICYLADDWLQQRLTKAALQYGVEQQVYESPNFLNVPAAVAPYFDKKKTYFQTDFYIWQRKQRNILLTPDGKPEGGQWTFDADNRAKWPKDLLAPRIDFEPENEYITEAQQYVATHFAHHYGHTQAPFTSGWYPITFDAAAAWLQNFLQQRFAQFGKYEDAMVAREQVLFHSALTPMLNIGLLQPQQVLDAALSYAQQHPVPLNSVEGFVRQIMGWREFIHLVYVREGGKQRSTNYWGFTRKIPPSFWNGTTGIVPVDTVIKKILQTGYCHHIERLMVLGNFMLLCEFDPDEVYRWFMELFIDSYDWVMVPNVYGMTQFADGGLMTTKPYISGSNYLFKMGDWPKGDWTAVWDGLFWRFMHTHRHFFAQNPRLGMLLGSWDKMEAAKRTAHLANAEKYLAQLK